MSTGTPDENDVVELELGEGFEKQLVDEPTNDDDDPATTQILVAHAAEPIPVAPFSMPRKIAPLLPGDEVEEEEERPTRVRPDGVEHLHVTVVNAATPEQRRAGRVASYDRNYLFVEIDGQPGKQLRMSRVQGFEHPPGGAWSPWRLSGRDLRRWKPI